jgi:hypothetical protein
LAKCRAGNKPAENIVVDKEVLESQLKADCFPCEGDITLAVRNANYALGPALVGPALGPVMSRLVTKPGAVVPKHLTCFSNACRAT